jgi:DNA-directed RNA polymerase specialized sigma24 family protein
MSASAWLASAWVSVGQPMTVGEEFTSRTGRFRGESLAHIYRMLGSAEEAEDLMQQTYLRAWRSYDKFEGRLSVRTWLYRIATNVSLTAIQRRRPLPSGLGAPSSSPSTILTSRVLETVDWPKAQDIGRRGWQRGRIRKQVPRPRWPPMPIRSPTGTARPPDTG